MMIFVSLLVATALTTLSESTPLSYSTYQRRGLADENRDTYIPYLIDGREASVNDLYWPQVPEEENVKVVNNTANNIRRMKKIQSLSVSNSLDVLRDRVLLELARRKAYQDQQQINENRRIFNNIGKRSMQTNAMNLSPHLEMKNDRIFDNQLIENPEQSRIDWYNMEDIANLYNKNDQLQQMETDELGLL